MLNDTTLDSKYVKYSLSEQIGTNKKEIKRNILGFEKESQEFYLDNIKEKRILTNQTLLKNESRTYYLNLWLDYDADIASSNKTYKSKIVVNGVFAESNILKKITNNTTNEGIWKNKDIINKVVFQDSIHPLTTEDNCRDDYCSELEVTEGPFDESNAQDKSVISYLAYDTNEGLNIAYIQSDGKLKLNEDSSYLFSEFSQLTSIEGMENLDTTKVTNMNHMFYYTNNLVNLDLNYLDTSNVTDMSYMFANMNSLPELDLSVLDTHNVVNMKSMFEESSIPTLTFGGKFNTSKVTDMQNMFFNLDLITTLDLSTFDTSNVKRMDDIFETINTLQELNINNWNLKNIIILDNDATNEEISAIDIKAEYVKANNVVFPKSCYRMLYGINTIELNNVDTSNVTNMSYMFSGLSEMSELDLSYFDTSHVTNMAGMFEDMNSLTSLKFSKKFDTSNVTDMYSMFANTYSLTNLNLIEANFNTSKVTDMGWMFNQTTIEELNLGDYFDTRNVDNMSGMFGGSINLYNIEYGSNFIHKEGAITKGMFGDEDSAGNISADCPASRPSVDTHPSWADVTF